MEMFFIIFTLALLLIPYTEAGSGKLLGGGKNNKGNPYFHTSMEGFTMNNIMQQNDLLRFPRYPTYATLWHTKKDDAITFAMAPSEDCQVVKICSVDSKVSTNVEKVDKNKVCGSNADGLVFNNMEKTVQVIKKDKVAESGYFFLSKVVLEDGKDKKRVFKYWSDGLENGNYSMPDKTATVELDYVIVAVSSPYCHVVVNSYTQDVVPFRHVTAKKLDDTVKDWGIVETRLTESMKTSNDLILGGQLANPKEDGNAKCCPSGFHLPGFQHRETWDINSNSKFSTVYSQYRYKVYEECQSDDLKKEEIISFKVEIDQPEKCWWLRVCFDQAGGMCTEAGQTLDIMPYDRLFIPTDNDKAVAFESDLSDIRNIRIRYIPNNKQTGAKNMLTLSYGHTSPVSSNYHHTMLLDWKWRTNSHVSLIRNGQCKAKIVEDRFDQSKGYADKTMNCLRITGCKCFK